MSIYNWSKKSSLVNRGGICQTDAAPAAYTKKFLTKPVDAYPYGVYNADEMKGKAKQE